MRNILEWIGAGIIFVLFLPMCVMSLVWDGRDHSLFWLLGIILTVSYYIWIIWLIAALGILL